MATPSQVLTTAQVKQIAGVSHMAIYHWRQGTSTRDPLPTVAGPTPRNVAFKPQALKSWAKKHGVELKHDPVAVASGAVKLKPVKPAEKKAVKAAKPAAKKAAKAVKKAAPAKRVTSVRDALLVVKKEGKKAPKEAVKAAKKG